MGKKLSALLLVAAAACTSEPVRLAPGDLLFQQTPPSAMSDAIVDATESDESSFTHVAMVVETQPEIRLIEAASEGGVRYTPLDEFLASSQRIGGRPAVVAMRLRDTTGAAAAVRRARQFLGQPYDYSYLPDNGKLYCSELIYESYRDAEGRPLFTARPMNFRAADGSMPQFWTELFEQLGEPIPEGVPGTNPNDMAREPILETIGRYYRK